MSDEYTFFFLKKERFNYHFSKRIPDEYIFKMKKIHYSLCKSSYGYKIIKLDKKLDSTIFLTKREYKTI